tara:strand:- start:4861 stop:5412 length:552 start_codon:yes stop_codon:yes gene_type:complete
MSSKSTKQTPAKLILTILIVIVAAFFGIDLINPDSTNQSSNTNTVQSPAVSDKAPKKPSAWSSGTSSVSESQHVLVELIEAEQSGQMVEFQARVVKMLADDNDGSRHQRFILAVDFTPSPADTVLVAHNIDLAPRVPLEVGDTIRIFGQYEWNTQGGVVHWTHHDPGGRHADGWIELDGERYE